MDGLTTMSIRNIHPDQAEFRSLLGKFYHRPPGRESWCDVILRLRSVMDMISLHHAGRRVMIFTHQVVVLCLRYIIEGMTEAKILATRPNTPAPPRASLTGRFARSEQSRPVEQLVPEAPN